MQLIIAGKAHPADQAGQALIQEWIHFIRQPEARPHVIFLSDYDMLLTEQLVQGVDVWINTPRRPWEACGTSGMKVLVNGGINLSELDGWWAEAYTPEVGWALGDGQEHGDDPAWDALEADALYDLLERRGDPGVLYPRRERHPHRMGQADAGKHGAIDAALLQPTARCANIRSNIIFPPPQPTVSVPPIRARSAGKSSIGGMRWIRSGARCASETCGSNPTRTHRMVEVEILLNGLDPNAVRVELYADGINGGDPVRQEMKWARTLPDGSRAAASIAPRYLRHVRRATTRLRVIPQRSGVAVPLECARILWQR